MYNAVGSLPVVILDNKADRDGEREVSQTEVATLGETYEAPYYLTSAKMTGDNVDQGLEAVIKLALQRRDILHDVSPEREAVVEDAGHPTSRS